MDNRDSDKVSEPLTELEDIAKKLANLAEEIKTMASIPIKAAVATEQSGERPFRKSRTTCFHQKANRVAS